MFEDCGKCVESEKLPSGSLNRSKIWLTAARLAFFFRLVEGRGIVKGGREGLPTIRARSSSVVRYVVILPRREDVGRVWSRLFCVFLSCLLARWIKKLHAMTLKCQKSVVTYHHETFFTVLRKSRLDQAHDCK